MSRRGREKSAWDDLRPGSLVARYRRRDKTNRHRGRPGGRVHGPSFPLDPPRGGQDRDQDHSPGSGGRLPVPRPDADGGRRLLHGRLSGKQSVTRGVGRSGRRGQTSITVGPGSGRPSRGLRTPGQQPGSRIGDEDEEGGDRKVPPPVPRLLKDSANRFGQAPGDQLIPPVHRVKIVQKDVLLHLIEDRGQVEE